MYQQLYKPNHLLKCPYTFYNHSFTDIYLYVKCDGVDTYEELCHLPKDSSEQKSITDKGKILKEGDIVFGVVKKNKNEEYIFTPQVKLLNHKKYIHFGLIDADFRGDNNTTQVGINSASTNFFIHNLYNVDVNVFYNCKYLFTLNKYDGLGYKGGSKSIKFTDEWNGFKVNDILQFYVDDVKIGEFKINEINISNVYVGIAKAF